MKELWHGGTGTHFFVSRILVGSTPVGEYVCT